MSKPFTLYWSNFKRFEECPQKFLWYSGWGNINLGAGAGKSKPKPVQPSEHHMLMGNVIQKVIELMYNRELWKKPKTLNNVLERITDQQFEFELAKSYIDWKLSPPKIDLYETCVNGIFGYLKTLKAHRLIGGYARSEVDLVAYINKWVSIGGRVDMLIRREDTGVSILDGKNSKAKNKHLDPEQLRYYALCFYLSYNQLPDRLGWVYFRYPYGMENKKTGEIEQGVEWIPFTMEDLKGLAQRAVDARRSMHKEHFGPTPTPSVCRWCDYETVCPPRLEQKAFNARKRGGSSLFPDSTGSTVFDFEDT